jgi:Ca2+-binding RTX toxin-like protein
MTIVTIGEAMPDYRWWPDFLEPNNTAQIAERTPTLLRWVNTDGSVVFVRGTGFEYVGGTAVAGEVDSITVRRAGETLISFTEVDGDLPAIFSYAFGFSRAGQDRQDASGFNMIFYLLHGNDTITGSDGGDDIAGGRDPGNDLINAGGGGDFIKDYEGADTINGGDGDGDSLSYTETYYEPTAFRGIVVNVGAGTVVDSWGDTNQISGIERFEGSKFRDVFNGGSGEDAFAGLSGADTFSGGAGEDRIAYWRDEGYGGSRGIVADLEAGTIRDGFGALDVVSGIEKIEGTNFNDSFAGDDGENIFQGGAGRDSYEGGAGFDNLYMSWDGAVAAVSIDLRLATGQIRNDGFNNVETTTGVERFTGGDRGDRMIGNGANNYFDGRQGNDTLSGLGGDDTLAGDGGADLLTGGGGEDTFRFRVRDDQRPWGDTITDFTSGVDTLRFDVDNFNGMDGTVRLVNGTASGGTGSWFIYNAANDTLYWDRNGTEDGGRVRVAVLTGVDSLQASDFDLSL